MTEKNVLQKKTALYNWHVSHGAVMSKFAGFCMPLRYPAGEIAEIRAVRMDAGVFDVSHMGEICVLGTSARDFLDFAVTRNLSAMKVGEAKYTFLCNKEGFPIDDLIIYLLHSEKEDQEEFPEEEFLLVVNADNIAKVYTALTHARKVFLDQCAAFGDTVHISNKSEEYSLLALQGPRSEKIISKISENEIPKKAYTCAYVFISGDPVLLLRSGYTGEDGFEILCPNTVSAKKIWDILLSCGVLPCGLIARDILRLEAGMPLYGHEISETRDPISAGYGQYVELTKPYYFIGKDALVKVAGRPTLHGFVVPKGRVPRAGCSVWNDDKRIGILTSAGYSPTLDQNIAMGYLDTPHEIGSTVFIEVGGKKYPAMVSELPFYRRVK